VSDAIDATGGLRFDQSWTGSDLNPFLSDSATVYGGGAFGQLSLFAALSMDTRDFPGAATRGARVDARASYYPGLLSVEKAYVRLEAVGSTYFSARTLPLNPTLAFRAGASRIFGEAPFFNAALLGGGRSLRGFDAERYAGDTAVYGTAELRLLIDKFRLAMLGDVGLLGFVDTGRVFVDGESQGGWHVGYGGGVWMTVFGPANTVSGVVGASEEQVSFYFWFGMPF
jgi:outer membrane protein assembly factor BamA